MTKISKDHVFAALNSYVNEPSVIGPRSVSRCLKVNVCMCIRNEVTVSEILVYIVIRLALYMCSYSYNKQHLKIL